MGINFKNFLSKSWPFILIFIVWLVFSNPYFLRNKVPFPSTYLVNFFSPWNAYPGFAGPVKNNAMPDVISQIYPWKTFTIESLKNFQIPLWNPYSFSGTPHVANYQSAVFSPFNLLFFVLPFVDAWSILVLLQPLLAGLFMFLFLRTLRVSKEGSVIGSLAFMFCGFITTWMAYATLAYAIIFLPLALFSIEKYYQTKKSKFLILLSISFPLSFFSGHFQISIYFLIFVAAYLMFKFFQTKNIFHTLYLILYAFIGILLSLPQLLLSIELYGQSLRSGIFQKIEAIPWTYIPTLIAPDFLGNPVTRNDWFGHYAEWNAYIGLIPLMLAFYSVFRRKERNVIFFLIMAIISMLLSFSTPFLDALINLKIPVLSTSAAGRAIVLFSFSMAVLAGFGLDILVEDIKKKNKKIFHWLMFFGIIFAFLWMVVAFKLFMPIDKITVARQNLILPTLLYISSAMIIFFGLFFKRERKHYTLSAILLILIIIVSFDMLRFAIKWMPFDSKSLMYPNVSVVSEFSKISGYERILSNLGGEATTYYKLPSVEGYDAVYIKRYGEFIASLKHGDLDESPRSVVLFPKYGLYTSSAVNLLGIKHVVHKASDGRAPWTFSFWTYKEGVFSLKFDDGSYQIFENNNSFPRAFLVNKYTVESNPQQILNTMFAPGFNLKNEVILEENPKLKLDEASGSAQILSYTPNNIGFESESTGNSLLFLSDTYYPGWEAYVDGNKTKILRADYTFRAVYVPRGKHKVEFIYNPLSFKLGVLFSVVGLISFPILGAIKRKLL